jgi:excinuclease UvrABC ATPase subunit
VLDGLTTAILVDQERMGADARFAVGAVTDANAVLRVLFSPLGKPYVGWPEAFLQVVTISRTGLTRLVDRLEAAGLVRRTPSPEDRRGTAVAITREGSALLRRMWPEYAKEIQRWFVDVLDQDEAAKLQETLHRVHAAAQRES